ncbi:MAG: CsbD family protein [Vicinamibacterales bacterium]
MNTDILAGQWKQLKGEVKRQWGKLTDDDMTTIEGSADSLIGKVQERYGYERDRAKREVDEFLSRHDVDEVED